MWYNITLKYSKWGKDIFVPRVIRGCPPRHRSLSLYLSFSLSLSLSFSVSLSLTHTRSDALHRSFFGQILSSRENVRRHHHLPPLANDVVTAFLFVFCFLLASAQTKRI